MPPLKTSRDAAIGEYLIRHSRQDDVLARVAAQTAAMPNSQMMSPPDEAALISMLARLVGATRRLGGRHLHGLRRDRHRARAG